ncbi:hypothetical protein FACS1894199_17360 [Bacteroidia bacterium]|nr:hypothetical protein FACS1894199_17360 [Bacteroidia bacterium]
MLVGNYQYNHPKVVHLELTAENTTLQGKELRIVVASDLHLGVLNDKQHALRFVDLINAHRPDIVLLAGDICDSDLRSIVRQNMNEELQQVKAPLGVYASIGNHEYIGGDVDACVAYLETGNVKVLRDASILVDSSFYIVGRDDRSNIERLPLSELMVATDSSKPRIVLDHQPFHLEEAEENGVSLQVSGHTHDGQFFPITLLVRSMYENAHGYSKRGRTHYYVSSGLGLWGPPYRIGSQSELVVIRWKY